MIRHDVNVSARILVVDNYDSFVFNLVQYLQQLGEQVEVRRNDEVTVAQAAGYDGVLLSPGPGTPAEAGVCIELVAELGDKLPIFGVCLGHQAIAEAYGATVSRAPELLHGKTSQIRHDGQGVFEQLPNPFTATRYHSLAVERASVSTDLCVTATTPSDVIMGIRHREYPVEGVQFHPESILTEHGHRLLANWLTTCGESEAVARSTEIAPLIPQ